MRALAAIAALVLLAKCCAAAAGDEAVMMDASGFGTTESTPAAVLGGVNLTCFKICQLGRHQQQAADRPKPAAAAAASTAKKGSEGNQPVDAVETHIHSSSSSPAAAGASSPAAGAASLPSTARRLMTSNNISTNATSNSTSTNATTTSNSTGQDINSSAGNTSTSTPTTSLAPVTSCAGLDPQAAALLAARYRGFQMHLALSDFFEIIYAAGNLWYAVIDLLKQGMASIATGKIEVNAESILLFNQNIAGITAWWGAVVQNMLLLAADGIRPVI